MLALGTHLINPYGRRFRVVRMVPEQDLVWRGLTEAKRWNVLPPPPPHCSACGAVVPDGTGIIAEHWLLCRPCLETL